MYRNTLCKVYKKSVRLLCIITPSDCLTRSAPCPSLPPSAPVDRPTRPQTRPRCRPDPDHAQTRDAPRTPRTRPAPLYARAHAHARQYHTPQMPVKARRSPYTRFLSRPRVFTLPREKARTAHCRAFYSVSRFSCRPPHIVASPTM